MRAHTVGRQVFGRLLVASLLATALVSGCSQQKTLYRWGVYETSLYSTMVKATEDPAKETERLAADLMRTEAEGKRVPPGVHAYLGWLLHVQGRESEARVHLSAERARFPESTRMIDAMLERIDRPNEAVDGAADTRRRAESVATASDSLTTIASDDPSAAKETHAVQSEADAVKAAIEGIKVP